MQEWLHFNLSPSGWIAQEYNSTYSKFGDFFNIILFYQVAVRDNCCSLFGFGVLRGKKIGNNKGRAKVWLFFLYEYWIFWFFFVYTFLLLIGIFRKETQVRIVNFNNFCFLSSCFVFLPRTTSKLLCIYFHFSYNPSVPSKLGTNAAWQTHQEFIHWHLSFHLSFWMTTIQVSQSLVCFFVACYVSGSASHRFAHKHTHT